MTPKLPIPDQSSYTEFLRSLEPFFISLTDSTFHGDREQYFENEKHELDVDWKTRLTKKWEESFDVRADVTIKIFAPDTKKEFFKLMASYLMHVHTAAPINAEHLKRFTEAEVRLIIWPYVREYATSIFGRMHVPPAILPVTGSKGK